MNDLASKSDEQLKQWIENHERTVSGTAKPLYLQLLEERARRLQLKQTLNLEKSLNHLKKAAITHIYISYGDLASASEVEWSRAYRQLNGPTGHLAVLLDICYARELPLLTAICVNREGIKSGELGETALTGFVNGARRLGFVVTDDRAFHHQCREKCWEWGSRQTALQ